METPPPHTVSTGPWHVQILSHAQTENAPTKLVLSQVSLKDIPSPQRGQLDAPSAKTNLFWRLTPVSLAASAPGTKRHPARFEGGALRLKSAGDQAGPLGIYSVDPVI